MAKDIFLISSEFSSGNMLNAQTSLQKAYDKLLSVELERINVTAYGYNGPYVFYVFSKFNSEYLGYVHQLKVYLDRCAALADYMSTSPAELDEADELYSRQRNRWWSNRCDSVADFFTGTKLKEETKYFLTDTDIDEIKESYNWEATFATEGQIQAVVDASISKDELKEGFDALFAETKKQIINYNDGVIKGTIRWVDQDAWRGSEYQKANGWANENTGEIELSTGIQCNSACASMALSFVGINRPPATIYNGGEYEKNMDPSSWGTTIQSWTTSTGETVQMEAHLKDFSMRDIDGKITAFSENVKEAKISPVIIRYTNGPNGHWLVITKNNGDGTYQVVGPAGERERNTTVTIDSSGNISGNSIAHGGGRIERYAQYSIQ